MAQLLETSLWVDFARASTPPAVKQIVFPFVVNRASHVCEPVTFEVLRNATAAEARSLMQQIALLPFLATPPDVWTLATDLGQTCRRKSVTAGAIDLVIAAVAIHHDAELVTFDTDYQRIASVSSLRVKLLQRPKP